MNFKQKLIQRHKNPKGLILRILNYLAIGYALWAHHLFLLLLLVLVDIINWFFMPIVKPKNELQFVNKIVQIEINWIKSPMSLIKLLTIITGLGLFILLGVGLWNHDWVSLLIAFVAISILKQLMLKILQNNNETRNSKTIDLNKDNSLTN